MLRRTGGFLRNTGGAASTARIVPRMVSSLSATYPLNLGLCVRGTCRAVSQEMTSPIAPDTATRDAATPAGAHLAAAALYFFLALVAAPAAARDTQDDSPIGQSAGASQSVAATVTCSSKPGERSSCAADTSKGVVLLRSTGDAPCLPGKSWGRVRRPDVEVVAHLWREEPPRERREELLQLDVLAQRNGVRVAEGVDYVRAAGVAPSVADDRITETPSKPAVDVTAVTMEAFVPVARVPPFTLEGQPQSLTIARPARSGGFSGPALRRGLIVSFGALQALDAHSTLKALKNGGREANPAMSAIASNGAALFAVKAGTVAATAYFAERLSKKHPKRAVVLMAVLNSAYVAVVAHNYRVARR